MKTLSDFLPAPIDSYFKDLLCEPEGDIISNIIFAMVDRGFNREHIKALISKANGTILDYEEKDCSKENDTMFALGYAVASMPVSQRYCYFLSAGNLDGNHSLQNIDAYWVGSAPETIARNLAWAYFAYENKAI